MRGTFSFGKEYPYEYPHYSNCSNQYSSLQPKSGITTGRSEILRGMNNTGKALEMQKDDL